MDAVFNVPSSREKIKKLQLETTVSRKTIVKKYRKSSKSYKRRNRRRRSKRAYSNMLNRERGSRATQELCNSIQEFSVVDMDMKPMCDLDQLPDEVIEWQNKDQLVYWKSRAISLELENKMLRQHLRNVYAKQIEYYEHCNKEWQEVSNNEEGSSTDKDDPATSKTSEVNKADKKQGSSMDSDASLGIQNATKVVPNEPIGKNRLKEMEKIYGDLAPKIMGMETAIELNYERLIEEDSPIYWPNIPINL